MVHAESAEVLSVYENDFYAGYPALTKNKYGEGCAYFIASENEIAFLWAFCQDVAEEAQVTCSLKARLPYGVTVSERKPLGSDESLAKKAEAGGSLWFVQNFNAYEVEIELEEEYRDIETREVWSGKRTLAAYQCLILEEML